MHPTDIPQASSARQTNPAMNRVLFLLGLSILINYIDRSNLSIAAELIKGELSLSDLQLGTLLSAFFWTYACMQIPAGWLVDRFDVKWVFAVGFFLWSGATATTGVLHGFAALILIRVILGIGESITFPSCSKILSTYFAENRRGFANAVLVAGLSLGPALGMLVGGTAVGRFGWRPFFFVLGVGGLLWLLPWLAWMPTSQRILSSSRTKVGIVDVLRQRSAWGTALGQFCINYTLYFVVTWLPSYLIRGRHLSMGQMAKVGGLVFFLSALSGITLGKLSDRWITVGASATLVRKTMICGGQTGFGLALAATVVAADSSYLWMLAFAGIFLGMSGSNCWAIAQTIAGPHVAGRWVGVQNFIGNFAGAVAPTLSGYLLGRTGEFLWPFAIAGVISVVGAVSWLFIVGPVEPVEWEKKISSELPIRVAPATGSVRP